MVAPEPVYVLLVDDLEENLISLEALLRRDGLTLLKARSGPDALEYMLEYEVALAIMDVQMPGMDGFETAELMRGTERTRKVPIIFLTAGAADSQRRFRGYEAGAVDFLQKPIEPDILKSKVKVFYDLCRQRQEVARQRDVMQSIAEENKRLLAESQQYLEALREADHRKDEFLATLAHELRNPLAPIRNGLVLLKDADKSTADLITMMERQVEHLVRLIDDLLDVSRVSHGKVELKKEIISFQSALQSAIETSKPVIEANNHSLTVNAPKEPIWLFADLTRLAQILANLLNNAAKYTPPGGGILVLASQKEGKATISVVDNGIGIPEDMLPKIFDLFTQVESNLESTRGGLGIGLALVKQLVVMHGGNIMAASEGASMGSIFTIELPIAPSPAANEDRPATISADSIKHARRILVVDDNADSAQTTGWMLEVLGHDYKLAHDGEEALAVAKSYRPHIILLDIGLPKLNGYEVCKILRQDSHFDDTVVIAQTGWGQQKDRQMAKEAGFDHHLVKPVALEKLTALINSAERSTAKQWEEDQVSYL